MMNYGYDRFINEAEKEKYKSFKPVFNTVLNTDRGWTKYDWMKVGYASADSAFHSVNSAIYVHGLSSEIGARKVGDMVFLFKLKKRGPNK